MRLKHLAAACVAALLLTACGGLPFIGTPPPAVATSSSPREVAATRPNSSRPANDKANDVVLYALGLIETGYRFGGKNPDAGLDCSGMVSYVFQQAANIKLQGSAADLAKGGKSVARSQLRPGDLVFFNTRNKPYSHVGIYIGDDRFVHAPSSRGKVRTESLSSGWFAARFEEARTYFGAL
jgi:cell wall-associated NlpC family hydrolase